MDPVNGLHATEFNGRELRLQHSIHGAHEYSVQPRHPFCFATGAELWRLPLLLLLLLLLVLLACLQDHASKQTNPLAGFACEISSFDSFTTLL